MNINLFIKSYAKDFWLLQIALQTIKRNVTGYNNLILLIPEKNKDTFDTRDLPERTLVHYVPDEGNGWLRQQYFKMTAHKYCFSEYIMFSDSDCFFTYPVNLQDVIKDDKPEILYTAWDKVGDAICWRKPTEAFIKEPVSHERMRRNQMCFHRSTLVAISEYEPNIEKIIMGSERWSEFNALAAFAFKYEHEKYKWTDTAEWTYVPALAEQVWSHSSKAEGASETHLREWIRLCESVLKCFGINMPA